MYVDELKKKTGAVLIRKPERGVARARSALVNQLLRLYLHSRRETKPLWFSRCLPFILAFVPKCRNSN